MMKLGITMFVLLGVFTITLSIHDTYAKTEVDNNDLDYLSYKNTEIGVTLEYPANWKLIDNIQDVPFVARFWAPAASGLISMDHMYRDTKMSPKMIAESHVKRLENRGDFLTSVEFKPLLISEYPAWQVTYSGITHELRPYTFSYVYVTTDNSRYSFTYHGGQHSEYFTIFNSIVDSVQISPVDMGHSSDDSSETSSSSSSSSANIPDWVEYNVRWWNEEKIDDDTMISTIEFLANRDIVTMPSEKEIDVYKISRESDPHTYDQIKHNAWTWAESDLRPENFLKGIGYLSSLNYQDDYLMNSKNSADCPQSFSSRCFAGMITEVIDGDTIRVGDITIYLALVSTPKLDEEGGEGAKGVVERICPIGTHALVDQDNVHQSDGFTADAPVLAAVYCNGLNVNEMLVHRELGSFDNTYCHDSIFANESWAREGCLQQDLLRK